MPSASDDRPENMCKYYFLIEAKISLNIKAFVSVEIGQVVRDNLLLSKKTRTLFGLIFVFQSHSVVLSMLYF